MKCPKYIKDKIMRRAKYAEAFIDLDNEISAWISSHNIDSEFAFPGYVEALAGTYDAAADTIKDIENA